MIYWKERNIQNKILNVNYFPFLKSDFEINKIHHFKITFGIKYPN